MKIEARELVVRLAGRQVLTDVSLAVETGEVIALVGPNGAGKSTLLRAFAGLLAPDDGSVLLDGQPLEEVARTTRARAIAYLPQGAECHWSLAVEDLVALGRLPFRLPWSGLQASDHAAVQRAIADADIGHLRGRAVTSLSAGERARALLARALAGEPRILLADEPITALDPSHQLQVMEILRQRAATGAAVVAVLHDLTLATRYADRVALVAGGQLVAAGPPDTVLDREHMQGVFGIEAIPVQIDGRIVMLPWRRIARHPESAP